ncbi:MAG: hypothetical protein NT053_13145 [Cyanobacteria bacterium]|nr:hypothetical protein [Cyanobacteriota bacterium]
MEGMIYGRVPRQSFPIKESSLASRFGGIGLGTIVLATILLRNSHIGAIPVEASRFGGRREARAGGRRSAWCPRAGEGHQEGLGFFGLPGATRRYRTRRSRSARRQPASRL